MPENFFNKLNSMVRGKSYESTAEVRNRAIQARLFKFRMELLRKHPFYGDILLKLPLVADTGIPTACTDGRTIRYNPNFFYTKTTEEYCYILMHEVLHALLMHPLRRGDRDPELWNVACDLTVNHMLDRLKWDLHPEVLGIARPDDALTAPEYSIYKMSTEEIYKKLLEDNKGRKSGKPVTFRLGSGNSSKSSVYRSAPADLIYGDDLSEEEKKNLENTIRNMVKAAIASCKTYSPNGSYSIPDRFIEFTQARKLPWKRLLQNYLEEGSSDESSYFTPERKYLHMDLIVPGPGERNQELGEVWAFIDDSGSIGQDVLNQFLTQLYSIMKDFSGSMNVAYWNTEVDSVYTNITDKKKLINAVPKGSGGTDASCVYQYLRDHKIRPEVMLLLTDGYFGDVPKELVPRTLKRKTIVVCSGSTLKDTDHLKALGKIACL